MKRISCNLQAHGKALFRKSGLLLGCAFLFMGATCVGPDNYSDYPDTSKPTCSWATADVVFSTIQLNLPECVTLFGTGAYPYMSFSEPFILAQMNPNAYGELTWTALNANCTETTMHAQSTKYTTTNDWSTLSSLYNILYGVEAHMGSGDVDAHISANVIIKIDNVLNTETGEYETVIWDSGTYSGTGGFLNLDFIKTAKVSPTTGVQKVYVHNQYVDL